MPVTIPSPSVDVDERDLAVPIAEVQSPFERISDVNLDAAAVGVPNVDSSEKLVFPSRKRVYHLIDDATDEDDNDYAHDSDVLN